MTGPVRQSTKLAACLLGSVSLVVVLTSGLLSACSTDDDSANAKGAADFCSAMCSWYKACGQEVSQSCVMACQSGNNIPSYARSAFLDIIGDCLAADLQCSGGSEASWQTCFQEAALTIAPNQAAFDACGALGTYFFECGYAESPEGCAGGLMYYGDSALARLSNCNTATCGELTTCITNAVSQP
ncbi:MAG: hypothetical protein ACM3ZE_28840 [Myxococcales bacterium]